MEYTLNTETTHLFIQGGIPANHKTYIVDIKSKQNDILLGIVKWYAPWRKYCFFPSSDTLFDNDCLKDITAVVEALNKGHSLIMKFHKQKGN